MNRIVVIEDDPAILRGLALTLQSESYEVLTAVNGGDGFRMVCENQPDLVILDLMLPGMNGYDICSSIRKHGMATPILMLTAQDQESSRVRGFEAGADDYVTKPFSIREIVGRVRAILRRSEGRPDLATQRELESARQIQQRLMPAEIPQVPGLQIAGTCRPARIVGGDYLDILKFDDGEIALCIADVCGKGLPAAIMMASLQAAVKTCASKRMSPRELCENVNRVMCENLGGRGFITFFYGSLKEGRRLTYCNAGHNPPVLARRNGTMCRLEGGGMVLGIRPDGVYEDREEALASGDRVLMYSDGITECRAPDGEEFGEERLNEVVRQAGNAETLTRLVVAAAMQFSSGDFEDDVTVLAVTID